MSQFNSKKLLQITDGREHVTRSPLAILSGPGVSNFHPQYSFTDIFLQYNPRISGEIIVWWDRSNTDDFYLRFKAAFYLLLFKSINQLKFKERIA
jgi:hypothetical protein